VLNFLNLREAATAHAATTGPDRGAGRYRRSDLAPARASRRLDELDSLTLSAVSYMELLQGMRDKTELVAVKKMLGLARCVYRAADRSDHAAGYHANGVA